MMPGTQNNSEVLDNKESYLISVLSLPKNNLHLKFNSFSSNHIFQGKTTLMKIQYLTFMFLTKWFKCKRNKKSDVCLELQSLRRSLGFDCHRKWTCQTDNIWTSKFALFFLLQCQRTQKIFACKVGDFNDIT